MRRPRSQGRPVSFAGIAFALAVLSGQAVCAEDAPGLDRLADALARVERLHRSLETTLKITVYDSRLVADETPWDEAEVTSEIRLHWIGHGGRFRLARIGPSPDDIAAANVNPAGEADFVSLWTGESWINHATAENTVSIYKRPKLNRGVDALSFFNGVDFTGLGIGALSHTVRHARLVERSSDGSRHRYVLSLDPGNPNRLEMVVDGERDLQLVSATFGFKESPLNMSVAYHVDEWGLYGDLRLPKRARREAFGTPKPGRGPVITRTVYLRESAKTLVDDPPPETIFAPPALSVGTGVVDRAALVSYTVGDRKMLIDGAVVYARDPVAAYPVDDLPRLLEPYETPRKATPDRLMDESRSFGWSIGVGILAFLATLALLKSGRWIVQRDSVSAGGSTIVMCLLALAAATVTGVLIEPRSQPRSLLEGELAHDFGEHVLEHRLDLPHAFVLKNVSKRALHVHDIRTTCGCVGAAASSTTVEPGESFTVDVTLRIETPRRRTETIEIDFGGDRVQKLHLSGTARRIHDLYAVQDAVLLSPQSAARILLVATNAASNDEPGEPMIRTPAGAAATFEGWRLVFVLDETSGRPARWQGAVVVRQTAEVLPSIAKLAVALGSSQEIAIDLTGRPWNGIASIP